MSTKKKKKKKKKKLAEKGYYKDGKKGCDKNGRTRKKMKRTFFMLESSSVCRFSCASRLERTAAKTITILKLIIISRRWGTRIGYEETDAQKK